LKGDGYTEYLLVLSYNTLILKVVRPANPTLVLGIGRSYDQGPANVRNQFKGRQGGAGDARLLAVVTTSKSEQGRRYRLAIPQDKLAIERASDELERIRASAPEDIPDEPLPYLRSIFNIHLLDVTKWSYLFTPRQLASLVILTRLVRRLGSEAQKQEIDPKLHEAVVTCLALAVDRVAAQFSSLSWWQPKGEFVVGTFGRQAFGIVWDFAEIRYPFSPPRHLCRDGAI